MNRIALALPLLALGTTGCLEAAVALQIADSLDRSEDWDYEGDDYVEYDEGYQSREVLGGHMRGTMAANGEFEREVTRGTFWSSGEWIEFEVHATGSAWAMVGGAFDTSRLEEGVPTELSLGEFDLVGCSGPYEYDFAYDGPADSVVVTEETVVDVDGEAALQYTFDTVFDNGDSTVTTVVVPVPDRD